MTYTSVNACHVPWCDQRATGHCYDDDESGVRTHVGAIGEVQPASLSDRNLIEREVMIDLVSVETLTMDENGVLTSLPAPTITLTVTARVAPLTAAEARVVAGQLLAAAERQESS